MRFIYRLRCEWNDTWSVEADDETPLNDEQCCCPEGHKAITIMREELLDQVTITLRPAARLVDPIRGQVLDDGKYWIELTALDGQSLRSRETHLWRDAIALVESFNGQPKSTVWERWDALNL